MSHTYSAHPALALEQLESAKWKKNDGSCNKPKTKRKDMLKENFENKIQPERTVSTTNDFSEEYLVYDEDELTDNMTKGCVNYTVASEDEPDALQQRINCRNKSTVAANDTAFDELNRLTQFQLNLARKNESLNECLSSVSSIMSSPSVSTISTPLSSPTRLTPHHQLQNSHMQCCCQKSIEPGTKIVNSEKKPVMMDTTGKHNLEQVKNKNELHHIHHHHQHHHKLSAVKNGCKKFKKLDLRLGPSPYRQLLPIALCILSFAVVFSLLIIYMDTTEIRHQQFRLNMSRDYDMYGVAQDNPQLIEFLREIHMRRYPMHFVKGRDTFTTEKSQAALNIYDNAYNNSLAHLNFSAQYDKNDLAPSMAQYVATLVGNKPNEGSFIQSLPGSLGHLLTAPWLAGTLNWVGIIVEPEARRYFALHKQNSQHSGLQVVQACVSPTPYPKEVTLHNEDSEVRINSLLEEETSWFNPRVKCFPLYTIMLACNRTKYDLLSLGVHGHELEILQTLPFEKLQISVISIHLPEDHEDSYSGSSQQYIQAITQFLINKSYKMVRQFGRNFFYQRQQQQNFTNRSRKKDELLLKTPSTFT